MLHSRPPGRRRATWAVASLAAATLLASPLTAAAADTGDPLADSPKVDSALASAVAEGEEATFFVVLKDQADLTGVERKATHGARAEAAYDELVEHAEASQESLTTYLDQQKVGHEDFWIANAVQVTGDAALIEALSKRSDVAEVVKEQQYYLDATESTLVGDVTDVNAATTAVPEWGIADINADDVWSTFENTGEGIVIANIDSGVQYDHPDLVGSYRGNNGDGTFTHEYNFYDPTGTCTDGPCDNNGHGTHTMGTMVGANGIGVAPGATWIAAKGCEGESCSDSSLLKAGQWIMAPTDANGNNPRPDLAPNIVNNSWGGGFTTFYQDIVEAWNAVGIFEAFAAGNAGDGVTCSTTEAPGAQAPVYGVGAYDVNGAIANFSGFGPSLVDGSSKPNIAAPGVNVRSTWPGSTYSAINGTSMATPHVAGAVALLWAASPALIGDIEGTRAILDGGARDVDDTHCGGTAERNNVWGEGKLDVLASVQAAPKGVALRHPLVRLTCYDRLSAVRRRQLHAAFARAVLRRRPEAVDVLARHFARADDPRAAEYLRRAAERAAALYANDTADRYYRDLVAQLDHDAAQARLDHVTVLRRMGRFDQAAEVLAPALAELVRRGDHDGAVLAAARLAEMLIRTGEADRAVAVLHSHPAAPGTGPEQAAAHHLAYAALHARQGDHADGVADADRALEAASRLTGPRAVGLVARAHVERATNLGLAGRVDEARRAADAALPHAEAYGDPTLLGRVLSTRRENARRAGLLSEAVAIGRSALDLVAQSGDPVSAAFERANLAELCLLLDDVDAAGDLARTALADAEAGAGWVLPYALVALGRVCTVTGRSDEAVRLLDRALSSALELADHQAQHEAATALADLALRTDRPADAVRVLSHADEAPVLAARCALATHDPRRAAELARGEADRAAAAGERLAQVDALIVLGAALRRDSEVARADEVLAEAEALAAALPYPAAVRGVTQV